MNDVMGAEVPSARESYLAAMGEVRRLLAAAKPVLMRYGLPASFDTPLALLIVADADEPVTATDLRCMIGSLNHSYLFARLVDAGCISRKPSDCDRRFVFLEITDLGREVAEALEEALSPSRGRGPGRLADRKTWEQRT